jgi:hypothetical protein
MDSSIILHHALQVLSTKNPELKRTEAVTNVEERTNEETGLALLLQPATKQKKVIARF